LDGDTQTRPDRDKGIHNAHIGIKHSACWSRRFPTLAFARTNEFQKDRQWEQSTLTKSFLFGSVSTVPEGFAASKQSQPTTRKISPPTNPFTSATRSVRVL